MMANKPRVKASGTGSSATSRRGEVKPTTPDDLRLRLKHTKDSIRYNEAHAREHDEALTKARKQLKQTQKALKKTGKQ